MLSGDKPCPHLRSLLPPGAVPRQSSENFTGSKALNKQLKSRYRSDCSSCRIALSEYFTILVIY